MGGGDLKGMPEVALPGGRTATGGILRPDALRALVDEHQSGHADHGQRLYALLFLELWRRRLKA